MPVLTPLWRQSLRETYIQIYTPNDPSDKNFFLICIKMHIYSFWLVYIHSRWSGQHPGGSSYILGPILGNSFFSKMSRIAFLGQELFWGGQKSITEDYHDWVLIGSPCLSVGDKRTCFHPLEHFLNHIHSFKAR